MHHLQYARPIVHYPGGLLAHLVEAGLVQPPKDDTGLNHWLAGQPAFPEAFVTCAARDLRLGPEATYIEFIPTDWAQAEAGGFTVADIAIGPSLGDEQFEVIAGPVVAAKLPLLRIWGQIEIVVNRTAYQIASNPTGSLTVVAVPLYGADVDRPEIEPTMDWLFQAFTTGLADAAIIGEIV